MTTSAGRDTERKEEEGVRGGGGAEAKTPYCLPPKRCIQLQGDKSLFTRMHQTRRLAASANWPCATLFHHFRLLIVSEQYCHSIESGFQVVLACYLSVTTYQNCVSAMHAVGSLRVRRTSCKLGPVRCGHPTCRCSAGLTNGERNRPRCRRRPRLSRWAHKI